MTAPPAVLPVPRPKTTREYDQRTTEQAFQALERDLSEKYDRRSDLILDPGKELVLTADNSSAQYGIGIDNSGYLRILDYSDGTIGTFSVAWSNVDGASQEITNLTAYVDAADATLTASVNTNASAIVVNGASIATITTELTAAREGEASLLANITDVRTAFANADTAIAADVTTLTARVTTNEGDISTNVANITTVTSTAATNAGAIATINTELTAAREGEASLLANITDVRTAFASADAAEASARATLQANLEAADTTLQANIDAEESARVTADAAEASARTTLQANLEAADTTLQASIDSEEAARVAADVAEAAARTTLTARFDESQVVNGAPPLSDTAAWEFDAGAWTYEDDATYGPSYLSPQANTRVRPVEPAHLDPLGYYKITVVAVGVRADTGLSDCLWRVGCDTFDASGAVVNNNIQAPSAAIAVAEVQELVFTFRGPNAASASGYTTAAGAGAVSFKPQGRVNPTDAGRAGDGEIRIISFTVERVRETVALEASITSEESARVTADAAEAAARTTLTAQVRGAESSLIPNALFQEEFSGTAVPPEWTHWSGTGGTWVTRTYGSGYAYSVSAAAGASSGIRQTGVPVQAGKKYLMAGEVVRTLGGSTLAGAGVLVHWFNSGGTYLAQHYITFATDATTSGVVDSAPDGVNRWEKEVTAPANAVTATLYAMNHWSTLGSIAAALTLTWRECNLVPVSNAQAQTTINAASIVAEESARVTADTAEAAARATLQANLESADTTLQSNIDTEASARATADTAEASARETLAARFAGSAGSIIPDAGYRDPSFWNYTGNSVFYDGSGLVSKQSEFRGLLLQDDGAGGVATYDFSSDFFDVIPGATYEITTIIWSGYPGFTGWVRPMIHVPGVQWQDAWATGPANVVSHSSTTATATDMTSASFSGTETYKWTAPTSTTKIQIRTKASITGSTAVWIRYEMRLMPQEAEVSILRDAFVDSSGNAYAAIRLVAAASGGTPAIIELKSGDGTSDVRLGGNTEIDGNLVVNGTITTDGLVANAVTQTAVDQNAATTTPTNATWTDVASFSFTSVGIGVELRGSCEVNIFTDGTTPTAQFRLVRDSTTLKTSQVYPFVDAGSGFSRVQHSIFLDHNDLPSAGTYTYKLQANLNHGTGAVVVSNRDVSNRFLSAKEFKR